MRRLVKRSGTIAVAILIATAFRFTAPSLARPQARQIPTRQEAAKVSIPISGVNKSVTPRKTGEALVAEIAGPNAAMCVAAYRQGILQVGPVLQRELHLLSKAAELTPSQKREVAVDAGRTLKDYVVHLATRTQANKPVMMAGVLRDPREIIRGHLKLAARAKLSDLQFSLYRDELERKARDRKEALLLNVVANFDKHLRLDADHRERLCEALRSGWNDQNYAVIESSPAYFVNLPIYDKLISPVLTEDQKKAWRSMPRVLLTNIGNSELTGILRAIDLEKVGEDDDVKAALAEEPI
jgi:hypothetical protein